MLIERSWQRAAKADFSLASTEPSSLSRASAEVWLCVNSYCHANDSIWANHQRQAMLAGASEGRRRRYRPRQMPDPLLTADDLALRPGGGVRSPWLREALAAEGDPPPLPGLSRDRSCDVAIVGGGYTGLWTALQLKERAPELEVVLLEQDICGGGPSGRNGGFVNAWWDELDTLEELYGAEPALAAARALSESVRAIGAWCEQHDVDAHYRHAGHAGRLHHGAARRPATRLGGGGATAGRPRGVRGAHPGRGPGALRIPALPKRRLHAGWGHRAAGAAGAGPATALRWNVASSSTSRAVRGRAWSATDRELRCWSTDRMGRIGSRPTRWSWR